MLIKTKFRKIVFIPALVKTPGGNTSGGYINHFLEPVITAFQAEVEFGSL